MREVGFHVQVSTLYHRRRGSQRVCARLSDELYTLWALYIYNTKDHRGEVDRLVHPRLSLSRSLFSAAIVVGLSLASSSFALLPSLPAPHPPSTGGGSFSPCAALPQIFISGSTANSGRTGRGDKSALGLNTHYTILLYLYLQNNKNYYIYIRLLSRYIFKGRVCACVCVCTLRSCELREEKCKKKRRKKNVVIECASTFRTNKLLYYYTRSPATARFCVFGRRHVFIIS